MTSISVSHLTEATEYQPGTINRTGTAVLQRQWFTVHRVRDECAAGPPASSTT